MTTSQMLRLSWRSWISQDLRIVGPRWLQYVWTFVFCAAMAIGFTVLGFATFGYAKGEWRAFAGWWFWFRVNMTVSLAIGYLIHFMFDLGSWLIGVERIRRFGKLQRLAYFSGLPIAGVMLGWPLGVQLAATLLDFRSPKWFFNFQPDAILISLALAMLITFVMYQFFEAKQSQAEAERQAAEARLKLLQGQIEPHFLFNTLANVVSLMDSDTPRAKQMLESFVDYLRSSLGSLRRGDQTLGQELELVDAYLRVLRIRMEDRLRCRIDVPADLHGAALPALVLQPLVENAIVHGLEPKVEGGELSIEARAEGGFLVVTVQDDGLGLSGSRPGAGLGQGSGTACRNIRERLLQRFGGDASLLVENLPAGGVLSTLRLPLEQATA